MRSRLAFVVVTFLLSACSGTPADPSVPTPSPPFTPGPTAGPSQTPTAGTTPEPTIRYECALITRDEIETLTGRTVHDAHVNPTLPEPNCVWQLVARPDEPKTDRALPYLQLHAWGPQLNAEVFGVYSRGQVPVPDVGDGAYWHEVCRWIEDVGPNGCELVFLLGDQMYSVRTGYLSEDALAEGDGEVRALDVEIAQTGIPRL